MNPRSPKSATNPVIRLLFGAVGLTAGTVFALVVILWISSVILPATAKNLYDSVGFGVQTPADAQLAALSETTFVYAADGQLVSELHDAVDRQVLPISEIPVLVQNAVVAAEDRKFWSHPGYDTEGIGRALLSNLKGSSGMQGGSTITQQLAKSAVGDRVTIERKLTELGFAIALERDLTKEQILERYLNQVYFGAGSYGIEAAAIEYFGVHAKDLSAAQAATLAGQIRQPGASDARQKPEVAKRRRDQTLDAMNELGWLSDEEMRVAKETPIVTVQSVVKKANYPYISDAVKLEFFEMPEFGATRLERIRRLFNDGLIIHTSFDPAMTEMARESVAQFFKKKTPTAVISAVDPRTGAIKVLYSNQDYFDKDDPSAKFNYALLGRRQPGSSLKPWVMATALELGYSPNMHLAGNSGAKFPTGDSWQTRGVKNYGGGNHGSPTMTQALIRSTNTAFAQLVVSIGIENMLNTMHSAGYNIEAITNGIHNPSIALGGTEIGVTSLEMASGFGTFANAGGHAKASLIDKVTDKHGNVLYERKPQYTEVISPENNKIMLSTMRSVVNGGTGGRAAISGWPVAGKTGTSQINADGWFAGVTPVLSTAVWVGHPEGRIPMYGLTGGSTPAMVWRSFMTKALAGQTNPGYPEVPYGDLVVAQQGDITVPDVRGKDLEEATKILEDLGLEVKASQVNSNKKRGEVLLQNPGNGAGVQKGAIISLTVSNGKKIIEATEEPSETPTATPTPSPTKSPSKQPTAEPSAKPTAHPAPVHTPDPKPTAPKPKPTLPGPKPRPTLPAPKPQPHDPPGGGDIDVAQPTAAPPPPGD